jgi:hypothetical protein
MPARRKSLEELAESGSLRGSIHRYKDRLEAAKRPIRPLGSPPKHLPPAERQAWTEIAMASPRGLLQRSDRIFFEVVCRMAVRVRTSTKVSDVNALATLLGMMAMTPSTRNKIAIDLPPKRDKQTEEDKRWAELDELD